MESKRYNSSKTLQPQAPRVLWAQGSGNAVRLPGTVREVPVSVSVQMVPRKGGGSASQYILSRQECRLTMDNWIFSIFLLVFYFSLGRGQGGWRRLLRGGEVVGFCRNFQSRGGSAFWRRCWVGGGGCMGAGRMSAHVRVGACPKKPASRPLKSWGNGVATMSVKFRSKKNAQTEYFGPNILRMSPEYLANVCRILLT